MFALHVPFRLRPKAPLFANGQTPNHSLLDLISGMPVEEAAKILRRPAGSVRSMLHRLGLGGKTGREWFTKSSLSRALHTRPDEIQKWIDRGWLIISLDLSPVRERNSTLSTPTISASS
jgi:hypothetical protein